MDNTLAVSDRDGANMLVADWVAMWNGDEAIAEEIISDDNRVHAAMFDGGDSAVGGVSGMKDLVVQMGTLMSDLVFSIDVGPLVDGDHVVVRGVATGHYGGGMPGGRSAGGQGNDLPRHRHPANRERSGHRKLAQR
ncbi:ester cyclase [Cryobacterium sp. LW097]|uniref:ester cyclase n=1 Tax=Cryobacterium sp. LW097 TaxID=1978566 RepID=UPI001F0C4CD6|nr:ester cyclase [Cryobacterium sp. LW097]